MERKTYAYNAPISLETLTHYFNTFKTELLEENINYIEMTIIITPASFLGGVESTEVELCKQIKIKLNTQNRDVISILKKNSKILIPHFKNRLFNEIIFLYKEISYSDFISPSLLFRKKLLLKSLIKKVK